MQRAPGIAKKRRSSEVVSRNAVSKTLVSRSPPQKRQFSDDRGSRTGSCMARECVRSVWPSIGVPGQYRRCAQAPFRHRSDDADHLGSVAPETFEAVVVALIGGKDVHDDAPVVEQDPARTTPALDAERSDTLLAQLVDQGTRQGVDLAIAATRADHEVVRHGGDFGGSQQHDVARLLVRGHVNDPMRQLGGIVQGIRYTFGQVRAPRVRVADGKGPDRESAPPPLAGQGSGWRDPLLPADGSGWRSLPDPDPRADGCAGTPFRSAQRATRPWGLGFRGVDR